MNEDPNRVISFTAKNQTATFYNFESKKFEDVDDLSVIFGDKTYNISIKELQDTLKSQKIYLSKFLPKKFYVELKKALIDDNYLVLPGNSRNPNKMTDFKPKSDRNLNKLISDVRKNYEKYGFDKLNTPDFIFDLDIYQVGSMVVKIEDYRIFLDGDGKIMERKENQNDSIRLINACGIRSFHHNRNRNNAINKMIMEETFKTSFIAAENGYIVFPAVGMGKIISNYFKVFGLVTLIFIGEHS
jgi:hypothetical protein